MTRLGGEEASAFLQGAIKERNARERDAFEELINAVADAQNVKRELQKVSAVLSECVPRHYMVLRLAWGELLCFSATS